MEILNALESVLVFVAEWFPMALCLFLVWVLIRKDTPQQLPDIEGLILRLQANLKERK